MQGVHERRHDADIIVLIGVSGSGKTTVGKNLAPSLGATYIEGDDFHPSANVAKMRSGQPLTDADRAPWLEKLGHVIAERAENGRTLVVACSALKRSYRELLQQSARRPLVFVHLAIPPAILDQRLKVRTRHFMPPSLLQSQLDTLQPLGVDEDGTEITEIGTTEQTVAAVRRWLHRRGNVTTHGAH